MTELKQPLKTEHLKIDKRLVNQAEIARRTGYSEAMISMLLNGKRKNEKLLAKIIEIIKNAA
ncbi:helix-turn-helix domain-containing protein [Ignavibacterium sp.]